VKLGSADCDRVVEPAAEVRHLGRQQDPAASVPDIHPVDPRPNLFHTGKQPKTGENGHGQLMCVT
jgi:hypothetical protein